jgi:3-hydroxyisobutyrate dehydrogenase
VEFPDAPVTGGRKGAVLDISTIVAGKSGSTELYMPKLLMGDLSPGFKAAYLKKVLGYVMEFANKANLSPPAIVMAFELYREMVERRLGELFIHALGMSTDVSRLC